MTALEIKRKSLLSDEMLTARQSGVAGLDMECPGQQFAQTSFKYLHLQHPLRRFCIRVLLSPWFERATMTVILVNCVTLGMYQPCVDTTVCDEKCQMLKIIDDVIYVYFVVEMMVKMIALGVMGKGCYLQETWNKLDCFIVVSGLIESALEYCLDVEKLNLSAIRTVRVLRPLRAINRIPSMRILVMLLLDTLPMLGNVLLLCFFVFFIFGIIGVQLWAGLLRQRCYISESYQRKLLGREGFRDIPNLYYKLEEEDLMPDYICSAPNTYGMHKCDNLPYYKMDGKECTLTVEEARYKQGCVNWNQYYTKCTTGPSNPFHGAISFDNIGLAWVAIFLVISLEGWTDVMYFVQDAHSFWNWIYFVCLIVVGSFFMINLCLVVIATQFSETKKRETAKMKAERAKFTSSSTLSSFTNSENTNLYREIIKVARHFIRRNYSRLRRMYRTFRAWRLERKEKQLLRKQAEIGKKYNVIKNVSTHSMLNDIDGELDMKLDLEDIGMCLNKSLDSNIPMTEKMTQTEPFPMSSTLTLSGTPNGTSPCNHPSLSCQELLDTAKTVSDSQTSQLVFDFANYKYCSIYNLAEGMDNRRQKEIYHLNHNLNVITPTKKKPMFRCVSACVKGISNFFGRIRSCLNFAVDHSIFQQGILLCIFINTFSMGIEYHDQPETLTRVVEVSNLVFSCIFTVEMILKLTAYGFIQYISDGFNVFDGFIVCLGSMELYNGIVYGVSEEGSGLSVLRTFRLLRILKLVRFLPNLRRQLIVMLKTMDNVAVFFGLLTLFIFIFSILGMNLFGCKFCDPETGICDRKNFDSLLWATVTVFQVLTQEDWNIVLFAGMERTSHWAALYFVALMTFGNYVLFNLLVAILVEGFSNQAESLQMDDKKSSVDPSEFKDDERRDSLDSEEVDSPFCECESPSPEPVYEKNNAVKEQNKNKGSKKGGKGKKKKPLTKKQYNKMLKKAKKHGFESTVMRPVSGGNQRQMIQAIVVPAEEIENHPDFADIREREGLGEGTSGAYQRKCSNCRKTTSEESLQNNSNGNRKKCKGGVVKEFTNNLSSGHKSLAEKFREYLAKRETHSLYIWQPNSRLRLFCQDLTSQGWFDFIILTFISANCITLAMERPNIPPWSTERYILGICNHVFTVVFAIEMVMKAIASGFIFGPNCYFSDNWNRMDGTLVIISLVDATITAVVGKKSKIFGMLRVFRLVRALRPLRVINRAPGLKLVVQTLLSSLKPIGNIVLICCTFFVIFGILGVQLFKGLFFYCDGPDVANQNITDKFQCLQFEENRWINQKYNFDNLGQALMSLFVLSSKDGWVDIMYHGLDAVGIDKQPKQNYNEWRLLYFISFLLLVGFFVLNMFVGVVVENFHRCRAEQEKEERAARAIKRAKKIEERRRKIELDGHKESNPEMMERPYYMDYGPTRLVIHKMVTSKYFDLAISAVIGLNVITMAMEFYMMPMELEFALKIFNYFFTGIFIIEACMKVSALGLQRYLSDRWNQLDVSIVFLSIIGIALEEIEGQVFPINPTIIRVMRVLRIARVLKLLKMAKGIRALLDTVMQALPQVGNLGLLFFLLFFIFAALGVELFGRLECDEEYPCQGLGEHAHFRSFGMAFLTLFRIATGDNWNGIMKDTLREECDESEECLRNCCVNQYVAPLFFVVFVLMAQFVLVNVVVAVLMKHLEESHKQYLLEEAQLAEEVGSKSESQTSDLGMEDDVEVELELEKQLALAHELFPAG